MPGQRHAAHGPNHERVRGGVTLALDEFQMFSAVTFGRARRRLHRRRRPQHNKDFTDYEGGVYVPGQVRRNY